MIQWFYRKIVIAIVASDGGYDITVAVYKNTKMLSQDKRRIWGENAHKDMLSFVRKQTELSPYHYIALLNPDPNQGALEGCSMHDINQEEEISGAKTLCRKQEWMLYTSVHEFEKLSHSYEAVGFDCLFSPFSVLEHFFADKIGGGIALYALAQKDSFSAAFFSEGKLEFAHHFSMQVMSGTPSGDNAGNIGFSVGIEEESETIGNGIHLDQIDILDDLEIIDDLDDLNDIEDLSQMEEIIEFAEDTPTMEEQHFTEQQAHPHEVKAEMDKLHDDYSRFEMIQKMLSRFYAGEHCKNRFVETVCIADAYGSGNELKRYLEEELFLNVLIRKIDLGDEVLALVAEEGL